MTSSIYSRYNYYGSPLPTTSPMPMTTGMSATSASTSAPAPMLHWPPSTTRHTPNTANYYPYAGAPWRASAASLNLGQDMPQGPVSQTCNICYTETTLVRTVEPQRTESFQTRSCGHRFCTDCMRQYIQTKISEGMRIIVCPQPECHTNLTTRDVARLAPSEERRYRELLTTDYRQRARADGAALGDLTRECPTCHVLVAKDGGCNEIVCTCGTRFCYVCGDERPRCACAENRRMEAQLLFEDVRRLREQRSRAQHSLQQAQRGQQRAEEVLKRFLRQHGVTTHDLAKYKVATATAEVNNNRMARRVRAVRDRWRMGRRQHSPSVLEDVERQWEMADALQTCRQRLHEAWRLQNTVITAEGDTPARDGGSGGGDGGATRVSHGNDDRGVVDDDDGDEDGTAVGSPSLGLNQQHMQPSLQPQRSPTAAAAAAAATTTTMIATAAAVSGADASSGLPAKRSRVHPSVALLAAIKGRGKDSDKSNSSSNNDNGSGAGSGDDDSRRRKEERNAFSGMNSMDKDAPQSLVKFRVWLQHKQRQHQRKQQQQQQQQQAGGGNNGASSASVPDPSSAAEVVKRLVGSCPWPKLSGSNLYSSSPPLSVPAAATTSVHTGRTTATTATTTDMTDAQLRDLVLIPASLMDWNSVSSSALLLAPATWAVCPKTATLLDELSTLRRQYLTQESVVVHARRRHGRHQRRRRRQRLPHHYIHATDPMIHVDAVGLDEMLGATPGDSGGDGGDSGDSRHGTIQQQQTADDRAQEALVRMERMREREEEIHAELQSMNHALYPAELLEPEAPLIFDEHMEIIMRVDTERQWYQRRVHALTRELVQVETDLIDMLDMHIAERERLLQQQDEQQPQEQMTRQQEQEQRRQHREQLRWRHRERRRLAGSLRRRHQLQDDDQLLEMQQTSMEMMQSLLDFTTQSPWMGDPHRYISSVMDTLVDDHNRDSSTSPVVQLHNRLQQRAEAVRNITRAASTPATTTTTAPATTPTPAATTPTPAATTPTPAATTPTPAATTTATAAAPVGEPAARAAPPLPLRSAPLPRHIRQRASLEAESDVSGRRAADRSARERTDLLQGIRDRYRRAVRHARHDYAFAGGLGRYGPRRNEARLSLVEARQLLATLRQERDNRHLE